MRSRQFLSPTFLSWSLWGSEKLMYVCKRERENYGWWTWEVLDCEGVSGILMSVFVWASENWLLPFGWLKDLCQICFNLKSIDRDQRCNFMEKKSSFRSHFATKYVKKTIGKFRTGKTWFHSLRARRHYFVGRTDNDFHLGNKQICIFSYHKVWHLLNEMAQRQRSILRLL